MSHFAKVENGIVVNVIVAEQDVIDSGIFGHGWVQTSYNTHGGQHPEGRPLRKNYAGIGYTYDSGRDAFIPPQPYPNADVAGKITVPYTEIRESTIIACLTEMYMQDSPKSLKSRLQEQLDYLKNVVSTDVPWKDQIFSVNF
jgi:hypothetical protein